MPNSKSIGVAALFVLIFSAIALFADRVTTENVINNDFLEPGRIARVVSHRNKGEYPVFGSSQACANYIPADLGKQYYNYCVKGANHSIVNMMLSYELQSSSSNPIVIDVRQGAIGFIGDIRDLIPFADTQTARGAIERNGFWRWYYGVPGLRYFGSYDWYLKGMLTQALQARGMHQLVGDRGNARGYTNDFAAPWSRAEFDQIIKKRLSLTERFGLETRDQQELLRLIESAPGRKFALVLSPLNWAFLAHVSNEETLSHQIKEWRSLPNVTVVDWTRKKYPDNYFFDTGHLNVHGATAFSQELKPLLDRTFAPAHSRPLLYP